LALQSRGVQLFSGEGPQQLLWAGSRDARVKVTRGIANCLHCCVILIPHVQFRDAAAGRITKSGAPHPTRGPLTATPPLTRNGDRTYSHVRHHKLALSTHTVYLCYPCGSDNKQRLFICLSTHELIFRLPRVAACKPE